MNYIIYFFITIAVLLIQTTIISLISIKGVEPDLLLILLIFISLRETRARAITIGFLIGLLHDLFATSLLGLSALTKSWIGFIAVSFAKRRTVDNYQPILVIFIVTSLVQGMLFSLVAAVGADVELFHDFFRYQLPTVLYTTIIGLLVAALLPGRFWQIQRDVNLNL